MSTYSARATGSFLEDYLDSIAGLPAEIKRNFELMKELDQVLKFAEFIFNFAPAEHQ